MYPYFHLGPLVLWSLGLMIGIGFSLAYLVGEVDFKRQCIPIPMGVFIPAIAIAGLVGSKLDHAIVADWHMMRHDPLASGWVATMWNGYTWFGGLVAGILAAIALARFYRTPVLRVLDASTVALSLGYACGRIGCFLAGDGDYGVPTSLPWAISFPHGIVPTVVRVHPTALYETASALILAAVLWQRRRPENHRRTWQGSQTSLYFFWTGFTRFLVEALSRNAKILAGLTEAQLVGIGFMLTAAAITVIRRHTGEKQERRAELGAADCGPMTVVVAGE